MKYDITSGLGTLSTENRLPYALVTEPTRVTDVDPGNENIHDHENDVTNGNEANVLSPFQKKKNVTNANDLTTSHSLLVKKDFALL